MLRWSRNDETSDHRGPLGDVFYLVGNAVVGLIVGRLVVDAWQPLIALVAATLASRLCRNYRGVRDYWGMRKHFATRW